MYLGILVLEIYFLEKDLSVKRSFINDIRMVANTRFNMSFSELDSYNNFDNVSFAFSIISINEVIVHSSLDNVLNFIKQLEGIKIVKKNKQIRDFTKEF